VTRLPERMEDRWASRVDVAPDEGAVYWHVLLHDYPEVRESATLVRERLAGFDGLHFTPDEWLHMTALSVGPRGAFTDQQLADMADKMTVSLSGVGPVPIRLGRILYHPQAIMLGIEPAAALLPLHLAAQEASGGVGPPADAVWVPHATVAYSTADQPAGPLIEALGTRLPDRTATLHSISLVIQWGPEREWRWTPIHTIQLGG
jgi:2'-5' RNA ligase